MAVHLRAHHLLCLLTLTGRGYNAASTSNMERNGAQLNSGVDDMVLINGPDQLCNPLLETADQHCFSASARYRDELAAWDITDYFGSAIRAGTVRPARSLSSL
jgi:hypothetical protein